MNCGEPQCLPAPSANPRAFAPQSDCGSRSAMARVRAAVAYAALAECRFCSHNCGVNRLAGEKGPCRAGAVPRVFSAQTEVSDELELIPTFAIAFSGCDLRCDFCITGSSSWNPLAGEPFSAAELATRARAALETGARTIMFLGGEPTIRLPAALDLVAALPDSAKLVWKTNANGSPEARALLDGLFDVWLADFKFGNDDCAMRLARAKSYMRVVGENLIWARAHSDLIVRHLLMPGHIDCCWRPVAEWIATELPQTRVNLRAGFWPSWHSSRHSELCGTVSIAENARARAIARDCDLCLIE